VRELRNVVERCVLLSEGPGFPERWLHLQLQASEPSSGVPDVGDALWLPMDGSMSLEAMERRILAEALERNHSNVSLTARVFGTTREKLRYRVQKYGLKATD